MTEPHRTVVSLFSGAMGFDLGLEAAGLDVRVVVEFDPACCATIRNNLPETPVLERDIRGLSTKDILEAGRLKLGEVFCVVGGPPCQSFSTGGKRGSITDPRGSLFMDYLRVIREARPSYFVFENVANIVTAPIRHRPIDQRPGKNWNLSAYSKNKNGGRRIDDDDEAEPLQPDEMSGAAVAVILEEFEQLGYHLTYGILNSADFGVAQRRLRFVMIGSRVTTSIELPRPTHSQEGKPPLHRWRSLRDVLAGLQDVTPMHSNYTPDFRRYFSLIPPGGNWRDLPEDLQKQALGEAAYAAGGGKTGFFRRLSWDEPTPTIVGKPNRKSSAICHPVEIRPLTVRECARVQGFPDGWCFSGAMHTQYLQIGNAVPVGLGKVVGEAIILAENARLTAGGEVPNERDLVAWRESKDSMTEQAQRKLRSYARNRIAFNEDRRLDLLTSRPSLDLLSSAESSTSRTDPSGDAP